MLTECVQKIKFHPLHIFGRISANVSLRKVTNKMLQNALLKLLQKHIDARKITVAELLFKAYLLTHAEKYIWNPIGIQLFVRKLLGQVHQETETLHWTSFSLNLVYIEARMHTSTIWSLICNLPSCAAALPSAMFWMKIPDTSSSKNNLNYQISREVFRKINESIETKMKQ